MSGGIVAAVILQAAGSEMERFGQEFGRILFGVFVVGCIIIAVKNSKKPK